MSSKSNGSPKGADNLIRQMEQKMKEYESEFKFILDPKPFIARLDGNRFSNFMKGFRKPNDYRVDTAMILTAQDAVIRFHCVSAYVQTDEISLIFQKNENNKERVLRLVSMISGYCSVRFNFHLARQQFDSATEKDLIEKVNSNVAFFDCRIFTLPTELDVTQNIFLRAAYARRNSKSVLGRAVLGHQAIQNLPSDTIARRIREEQDVNWNDFAPFFKYGVVLKRQKKANNTCVISSGQFLLLSSQLCGQRVMDFDNRTDYTEQEVVSTVMGHDSSDIPVGMGRLFTTIGDFVATTQSVEEKVESKYGHHFKEMEPELYEAKSNRIDEFFEGMELELKKDINLNSPPPVKTSNVPPKIAPSNANRPVPMQLECTPLTIDESLSVLELWHETRPAVVQITQNEISAGPKHVIEKWIASIGQDTSKMKIDTARWTEGGLNTYITKVILPIRLDPCLGISGGLGESAISADESLALAYKDAVDLLVEQNLIHILQ
jgi:tRNA(His) 5'-end guanylyltransferase